ncbi:hypoxanthine phosphoribosyltransferase [Desulfocurvus sp.]|jgi:hypoxanthine phosphoribosyltransferase|uniref:hypoxanthine phosphoribosyltransferase n=1 Tax=Desulfocurvus sp. TaxID=2871698 RepID=UPI0025BA7030|nr:hypoxanthine phosphoribosyltransferase [Desulfocurvus sp.]MCK9239922.1 hypoxanthine phosphoribosyltransferase [Desulfocurvus sp.]
MTTKTATPSLAANMKPVLTPEVIAARVRELGAEITGVYRGQPLTVVCVLKGAFLFFADLVRHIDLDLELEFIRLASYGKGMESGELVFSKDMETSILDKNVLVVEDIVDSGRSMDFLLRTFAERKPRSLRLAALVDKFERREVPLDVDFSGFTLHKGFIVGYGMDYAEHYRQLGGIFEIET